MATSLTLTIDRLRADIARQLRERRKARGWTQAHLAALIGLSQSRLSEIERGAGSLNAEQLVLAGRAFNLPLSALVGDVDADRTGELQNALVRHGARHLRADPSVSPSSRYERPLQILVDVLVDPRSERWVTALAAVFVWSVDTTPLPALAAALAEAGVPRRAGWFAENMMEATASAFDVRSRNWAVRVRRAHALATGFVTSVQPPPDATAFDPFDPGFRTAASIHRAIASASDASRRWRVASTLQPSDFAASLLDACLVD